MNVGVHGGRILVLVAAIYLLLAVGGMLWVVLA